MSRAPRGKQAAKRKAGKSASKSAKGPRLVPRPDGRGALLDGGQPGNAGGTGRPPSAVRQACRDAFDVRIPKLMAIADGSDAAETLRSMDILARYGLGERDATIDREAIRESLRAQRKIIREVLPEDAAEALLTRLRLEVWG